MLYIEAIVRFLFNPYIVALFSVLATIFILKRKEKLDGLRSLDYELNQNNVLMKWNINNLINDIEVVNNDKKLFPISLSLLPISSFEHNKNLGNIGGFHDSMENLVSNYYGEICITNRQIEGRELLKMNLDADDFCKTMLILDVALLIQHFSLISPDYLYKVDINIYKKLYNDLNSGLLENENTDLINEIRLIVEQIILRHSDNKWSEEERIKSFNLTMKRRFYHAFPTKLLITYLKREISKYRILSKIT